MKTLKTIKEIILSRQDNEILFSDPLVIKSSPHQHVFTCYGVHAERDEVWLMDGVGEWHGPLSEQQVNAQLVINSLYQRLKSLEENAA